MVVAAAAPKQPGPESRWDSLAWHAPVPPERYWIPPGHYRLDDGGLAEPTRVALNHLAVCFSCEMFIHFERYVIEVLESRLEQPGVSRAAVTRFAAEERRHVRAFHRLLGRLDPARDGGLRWFAWTWADRQLVRRTPSLTFFLLAELFEEITLHVPAAMAEAPEQSFALVGQVMQLHAEEERRHVAIDRRIVATLARGLGVAEQAAQVALAGPLVLYLDRRVGSAWRHAARAFGQRHQLGRRQIARLIRRPPSVSDVVGMQSFAARLRQLELAGAPVLAALLERAAR